jgi:hypothetical protein
MPTINTIGFTVKFDLLSTPTLVLTDTTTYPLGAVGRFSITQPDGYTRVGSFASPDITSSGGAYSSAVRLSSTGGLQAGQWEILYEIQTTDEVITTFSRIFQLDYEAVVPVLREDFDVFTPRLRYFDDTVYARSNYNASAITRAWSVSSTPTGTKTSTAISIDLVHNSSYYDATYTISFTASLLYTHQVYAWLTIDERVSGSNSSYAQTPPGLTSLVSQISELKTILNSKVDTVSEFGSIKADFEYAEVLFLHIINKIKTQDLSDIYRDLKDLIAVLNNYQLPQYVACNCPILPYDLTSYFPGAVWGNIAGTISNQTDLWNYITLFTTQNNFVFDKPVPDTVWVVNHNMGKYPSVSIVDTANDQVEGELRYNSINQLTLTFTAAIAGKAYLN